MALAHVAAGTNRIQVGSGGGFPAWVRHRAAPVDRQRVGPIVLGEAARIHPVVVIMSFVCGAILFGVVGLLIAVPAAVCIKVTLRQYYSEPIVDSEPNSGG